MRSATKYQGWWRCRIKGRSRTYPWIYFEVAGPSKGAYRRQARLAAQLHLQRVDFDFEQAYPPQTLKLIATAYGFTYFADTTFGAPAKVESVAQRGGAA
jgi:hypothetical protein